MNQLKMDIQQTISTLSRGGWSQRRIARELGIDRETVARYRRLARQVAEPKPANSPAGSEPTEGPKPAIVPPGPEVTTAPSHPPTESSKPAISPAGSKPGRVSHCEPFESFIKAGLDGRLSAQRIYQDLVSEQKFAGSYDSVKRFVRQLQQASPLPFRRMESEPGQEAQVDFGQGAWVVQDGRRRRPHVLRLVLSHSRKGYTEVFWQQTTENFIRGIENAFRHWGGVVATLVIDNLRAAVKKVDWFEPELNPKVTSFCEHYGTVILPTKPAMPRHKGKVEAGVKYVQANGLAGKQFEGLGAQNVHLAHWEETVADTRIHGTTRQQVRTHFLTVEKPKLLPLLVRQNHIGASLPRLDAATGFYLVCQDSDLAPSLGASLCMSRSMRGRSLSSAAIIASRPPHLQQAMDCSVIGIPSRRFTPFVAMLQSSHSGQSYHPSSR